MPYALMIWDALLLLSLLWLCLRLYQLSKVPRDFLEERLGYDLSPVPEISVAGIRPSSVLLCWLNAKDPGFANATLILLCNGIKCMEILLSPADEGAKTLPIVGEIHRGQDIVEVFPLKSNRSYALRLLSVNSGTVSTASTTTRFQTLPSREDDVDDRQKEPAKIHATPLPLCSEAAQIPVKENAGILQSTPKPVIGRRTPAQLLTFSADAGDTYVTSDSEEDDSLHLVQSLTRRLEELKRQNDDLVRQLEDEDAVARLGQAALLKERDQLKQELREKEDNSTDLKKQGNQLEKLNRSAQNKRVTRERLLSQKRAGRHKAVNDVERWAAESLEVQKNLNAMQDEIRTTRNNHDQQIQNLRQVLDVDQTAIKCLEDEIRVSGSHIKELEQRNSVQNGAATVPLNSAAERSRDEAWQMRMKALQLRLQSVWNALSQSRFEEQSAEDRVSWFSAKSAVHLDDAAAAQLEDSCDFASGARLPRSGHSHIRSSTHPSASAYRTVPLHLRPSSFGSRSGFDLPSRLPLSDEFLALPSEDMAQAEIASPAAKNLLPSYLLRDDDLVRKPMSQESTNMVAASKLIGHMLTTSDASLQDHQTPLSANSRTGSTAISPHASAHDITSYCQEDESLPSNHINLAPNAAPSNGPSQQSGSRFANLFSPFGRQKGKTSEQEPPALGSLKQGQSQSFPRKIGDDSAESNGLRRRRGSHGAWASPVSGLIGRVGAQAYVNRTGASEDPGGGRLNFFKTRLNTVEIGSLGDGEHADSRPSSAYSHEQSFCRPSSENQSIWGSTGESSLMRDTPKNSIWSGAPGPWSQNMSRRASIQYGSSTNLAIGSTPLAADDLGRTHLKARAEQAPIGTRPAHQSTSTPRLNPAAPSFKTLFSRSESKRVTKAEKNPSRNNGAPADREGEKNTMEIFESQDEASPPTSRMSRDARSIATAASTADSHESFERSAPGAASDSPIPKETLMQKLTRKSSSSKFNVPWSKERSIFTKRTGELVPSEGETESPIEGNGTGPSDSTASAHREEKSARGWPSIRRRPRKEVEVPGHDSDLTDDEI